MADIAGEVINTPAVTLGDGVAANPGDVIDPLGGLRIIYMFQAKDSVTASLFTWATAELDYAGAHYPGPNAATQVALVGRRQGL